MARIFLSAGETTDVFGSSANSVFGTNSAENVAISANANVVFDASFNRGGDVIEIGGRAADYTARISGSSLILTAANGANITIPIGTAGATLVFLGSEPRVLAFDAARDTVQLGTQTIAPEGATPLLAAGSGGSDGSGTGTGGTGTGGTGTDGTGTGISGGAGDDKITLSSNPDSVERIVLETMFGTDHVLNFAAGQPFTVAPATAETQVITFTSDDAGTAQDLSVVVYIDDGSADGYDVTVDIAAGADAGDISDAVATALAGRPGVTATSDGAGTVTLAYDAALGDVDQATCEIVAADPTETQQVAVSGVQQDAATVTLTFAGETFTVSVPAGASAAQIEQALVTVVQNSGSADVDASIVGALDGTFELYYRGDADPAAATVMTMSSGPDADAAYAVTTPEPFMAFDPGADCAEATTVDGADAVIGFRGFDIIDLSDLIGVRVPEYFQNTMQADGAEPAAIDALIDSGQSGIILIDKVDADPSRTELEEIRALATAADGATQVGTDLSVIITVENTASDPNGTYGDFYLVSDGPGAGDAATSYLGRMFLGGSNLPGKEDIGNFDMLTIKNFTPLTPSEIIDAYGTVI